LGIWCNVSFKEMLDLNGGIKKKKEEEKKKKKKKE